MEEAEYDKDKSDQKKPKLSRKKARFCSSNVQYFRAIM